MFINLNLNEPKWEKNPAEPSIGSVLYCKLLGNIEHSGIFLGNLGIGERCIVEIGGDGIVRLVTPKEFLNGPNGKRLSGNNIYTSCDYYGYSLKNVDVAQRAKSMVGKKLKYDAAFKNCHQFISGCLNGNFENKHNLFWMLEEEISISLNYGFPINWYNWDFKDFMNPSKLDKELSLDEKYELRVEEYRRKTQEILSQIKNTKD